MKVRFLILFTLLCVTLILISKLITPAHATNQPVQENIAQRKIAPWVMDHTENGVEAEFLVILRDKADLSRAKALQTKQEKGQFVRDALLSKAQQSQAPLLRWLSARHSAYGISIPAGATIQGIEVRLQAKVDNTGGSPHMCVELSWDGGTTWTTPKSTATLSTSELTYLLGGTTDQWGRTWTTGELSNANLRVRITDVASNTARDFSLDWVAVRVSY